MQQLEVGADTDFACFLLSGGLLRCTGDDANGRATPPADLGLVTQIGVGVEHACALTVSAQPRCWGSDTDGRATPPDNLEAVTQLGVGFLHTCALTVLGQVHCWGSDTDGRSTPPSWAGAGGAVGGWAESQLRVDGGGSSALLGQRCWMVVPLPPDDLGPVTQLDLGDEHSCALTVLGSVRCWGSDADGRTMPPDDLGAVTQLDVGDEHSCALTVLGELRCWGGRVVDISSLPPGLVTAIESSGFCALLADGSLYCRPDRQDLAPPELRPGEVVMSVWPRQLEPGQRAAIRFADLRESTAAFTARIEVYGDGVAELDRDYRLLDSSGQPLDANSALLTGNPPMAWLEALTDDQILSLRVYVRPLGLLPASGSTPTIRLVTQSVELVAEVLASLTVTGPAVLPQQTVPGEPVLFELRVTAAGSRGTEPWQPTELLALQHTAGLGVTVDYAEMPLMFTAGVATVTVSVTPDPGNDALVTFSVKTQDPADVADLIGLAISPAEVSVGAVEVLSTVTLTVPGGLLRTPGSGQEDILITVELMTESFGGNEARQRELTLRAVATNGVKAPDDVVVVIDNGFGTAALSLMLGDAEQTTVSFEVVDLPSGVSLISPELRVELVPVPASLAISALPQAMLELAPRGAVVVEFVVKVEVQGSDGQPFGGLSDLVLSTTVTAVADADRGRDELVLSSAALEETAKGVYESTVTVTIDDGQVSMASVEITVAGGGTNGLASAAVTVQLARPVIVDSLELSLADVVLEQSAAGVSVQTTATVSVQNQFGQPFSPTGLRLRVVDTATETEVLVTTPALVFDALGVAQSVLELNPRGRNRELRVDVIGVAAPGVTGNTTTLTLTAVEALGSLTVTGAE